MSSRFRQHNPLHAHQLTALRSALYVSAALFLLFLTACTPAIKWTVRPENNSCEMMWQEIDQTLARFDIYDAATSRVVGYPFLRNNRFYATTASQFELPEQQRQIVRQLQQLDLEGRYRELNRLPTAQQQELSQRWAGTPTLGALKAKVSRCSGTFLRQTFNQEGFYPQLVAALPMHDDYSTWQRGVGLYPLTSWFVENAAQKAHVSMQQRVQSYEASESPQKSVLYTPKARAPLSLRAMRAILKSTRDNWVSISFLNSGDMQRLAHSWAPTLRQFINKDHGTDNLIGRVYRHHNGIQIDTQQPTVYYYTSHTLLQGQPTIQINYVFWYAANHSKELAWWARGNLDGFTLRYTLTRSGQLAMVDLIKNCGCYHGFIPDDNLFDITNLKQTQRSAQILQALPQQQERQRLQFILSDSQQILHVDADTGEDHDTQPYLLRPYNDLEQLADENGTIGSLFDQRGIVPNTTRAERVFLFPMGIKSVGSMRQRGHHPITLIGRDHFDNPNFFDETFHYLQPPAKPDHYLRRSSSGLSKRVNSLKQIQQQPYPKRGVRP